MREREGPIPGASVMRRPDRRKLRLRREGRWDGAGFAGAHVVDAADPRARFLMPQPQHHLGTILDVDEVAPLLAVAIVRAVRLEQPNRLAGSDPPPVLDDEAHHLALVVLVGAE